MNPCAPSYYRHRFPSEIISRCVWLYFRFALSYRDVEEMMHERGVNVTYETAREWCLKFGHLCARRRSTRYSGAVTPEQAGGQEILSQAAQSYAVRAVIITDKLGSYAADIVKLRC
jgi:hypothetical protein